MTAPEAPSLLRPPGPPAGTGIGAYLEFLSSAHGLEFDDYRELWRWSVAEPEAFWASIWDHYGVSAAKTTIDPPRACKPPQTTTATAPRR